MDIRHLATKGFGNDIKIRKTQVVPELPILIDLGRRDLSIEADPDGDFNQSMPMEINSIASLTQAKKDLLNGNLKDVVSEDGSTIKPLSKMFGYTVGDSDIFNKSGIDVGTKFTTLFENEGLKGYLKNTAQKMFPNIHPETNAPDIDPFRFYTPYIPLVALSGSLPPQTKYNNAYFNPEGSVTLAEFLDSLNAIKYGCNSDIARMQTLDNVSTKYDYFNEGYQSCIRGVSSPFFNLYRREELLRPVTRLEVAYIIVICWRPFIEKFNNLYGGDYYLGLSFDWLYPNDILNQYIDGKDYKISKYVIDSEYDVISLNIKDYKSYDRTMAEYIEAINSGEAAIPLPAYMSMLELGVLNFFLYEDKYLHPCREVSRGELSYLLTQLAINFPNK